MARKKSRPLECPRAVETLVELLEKTREHYLASEFPWLWESLLQSDDSDDAHGELYGQAIVLLESILKDDYLVAWDGELAEGIAALQEAIEIAGLM